MSTTNNDFFLTPAGIEKGKSSGFSAVLRSAVVALLLAGTVAQGATDDKAAEEKPRSIVPVFRLGGPLTEAPVGETFPMFGPLGTSLKELVERLAKAADDSAVKAVVILPETLSLGSAQVEEVRAAMSLVRNHG